MLDCGFVTREVERRIARFDIDPSSLAGILVTHEHSDHVGGVFRLARRYGLPVSGLAIHEMGLGDVRNPEQVELLRQTLRNMARLK